MSLLCPDHTDEAVAIGELQFCCCVEFLFFGKSSSIR